MTVFAVIAGGGTSGHVLPALAIADALVERGHPRSNLLYMGTQRGIETSIVPPTGTPAVFDDVIGLQRSLRSWRANLGFFPRLWRARRRTIARFRADRPAVVVSVGGYASLPAVLAARRLGVPIVVVSYDRRPGRSSRMTARFASVSATAFPDSVLPRAVHCGAPVRAELRRLDRDADKVAARHRLDIPPNRFLVAVVGGSLGSGALNAAVESLVRQCRDDANLAVFHVAGERFVTDVRLRMNELLDATTNDSDRDAHALAYRLVGYHERMADVYAAADVIVTRGGAGTVAEIATVGVPSILVPWSGAADDHQTENVRWLSDAGAAVLSTDDRVIDDLPGLVASLRSDPERLAGMGRCAFELGEANRRALVADVVIDAARGRSPE